MFTQYTPSHYIYLPPTGKKRKMHYHKNVKMKIGKAIMPSEGEPTLIFIYISS